MHNFTVLHKLSEDFIIGNFVQICEGDELGDLSKDQFIKFLNSEYLCVDSEQQVFLTFYLYILFICYLTYYIIHAGISCSYEMD